MDMPPEKAGNGQFRYSWPLRCGAGNAVSFIFIISCSKFCVKDSAPHEKVKKKSFHLLFLVHFVMRDFNAQLSFACAFAIAGFFSYLGRFFKNYVLN